MAVRRGPGVAGGHSTAMVIPEAPSGRKGGSASCSIVTAVFQTSDRGSSLPLPCVSLSDTALHLHDCARNERK